MICINIFLEYNNKVIIDLIEIENINIGLYHGFND